MSLIKHSADSPLRKRRKTEKDVIDYKDSDQSWEVERNLADQIMVHVRKYNLEFKLDKLTRGHGNCFMIAVLQQLQQDHIYQALSEPVKALANGFSHRSFRLAIYNFINQSNDPRILNIKEQYNESWRAGIVTESWQEYWERMKENETEDKAEETRIIKGY